jgi:hypothetical protein
MAMGEQVINPCDRGPFKKKGVRTESTHGKNTAGKLGLQASLNLIKKSNIKAFFSYYTVTSYASSVLYNHTRKLN